jgi:hypothetical protein
MEGKKKTGNNTLSICSEKSGLFSKITFGLEIYHLKSGHFEGFF